MKRFTLALIVVALVGLLGGCLSLKPFTQDELSRLSSDGRAASLSGY
jgi:hypothetical protein